MYATVTSVTGINFVVQLDICFGNLYVIFDVLDDNSLLCLFIYPNPIRSISSVTWSATRFSTSPRTSFTKKSATWSQTSFGRKQVLSKI